MESSGKDSRGLEEPKPSLRSRYFSQCRIVMTSAIVSISSGMIQLWPNNLASHLAKSNSTIFGNEINLTDWQMDLVGSMTHLGSLVGFLIAGYLVSRVGRRWSLAITAIPGIFGATLITLAATTYMIIIGRFLDGITNGMMTVAVYTYVAEIADPKIRGSMSALATLLMQCGGLLTVSLGISLSWYYISLICGCLLIVHCLLVPTLHESPSYLAIRCHERKALNVLQKLRGSYIDVQEELTFIQDQNQRSGKKQGYGVLLKREHMKSIALMSGVFFIHNFCGTQILRVNATRQLIEFGLALDEAKCTLLVIGVFVLGNLSMALALDRFGRRRCLMTSLVLVALSYAILGTFMFLGKSDQRLTEREIVGGHHAFNMTVTDESSESSSTFGIETWLPLLCLMVASFGHGFAIGPLVWVLSPEMFPTSIRSQGTSICTIIGSLQTFVVLQLFSQIQASLTQAGMYWGFAGVAAAGIFYIYFLLKETTGSRVG